MNTTEIGLCQQVAVSQPSLQKNYTLVW